jgi:2-oxoglutarate ferredoxin oxidoreductase subunit delta
LILNYFKFIKYKKFKQHKFFGEKMTIGMIEINQELCKDCKLCITVCPKGLIEPSDQVNEKGYFPARYIEKHLKKENRRCTGCALCAISCPEIAIEVYRE